MKCNRDPVIRGFLACLGVGFNCSSKQDVQELLALNHNPARITYTHPYKTKAFLEYAALNNVKRLTVESIEEMILVREHHPKAELLLRLASFHFVSGKMQQSEFGLHRAKSLDFLLAAKASRLNVVGVAFHVEADRSDPTVFQEAMVSSVEDSRAVFQQATEVGFAMSLLDVGGGFRDQGFEKSALTLNHTLDKHCLTDCEILVEPGRVFVSSAVTKACQVIGKRYVPTPTGDMCHMLYLNDSIYDNFSNIIHDTGTATPHVIDTTHSPNESIFSPEKLSQKYRVCGATTNVSDRLCEDCYLPKGLDIGDWLYFPNMGGTKTFPATTMTRLIRILAYSRSTSSRLNSDNSADDEIHCMCSDEEARLIANPLIASIHVP